MAQGPSVASFILHLGLCGLVQGSTHNPMGDGMRDLSQELTHRVLEGVGKGQSRREATGSEKAPASPFGQPSTKIGQPREGPLASCTSVWCPYQASGGTGLGTEQRRARSSGTSGRLCILSSTASDHSTFSDGDCHSCTFKVNV